jgi:hypothetical protein
LANGLIVLDLMREKPSIRALLKVNFEGQKTMYGAVTTFDRVDFREVELLKGMESRQVKGNSIPYILRTFGSDIILIQRSLQTTFNRTSRNSLTDRSNLGWRHAINRVNTTKGA